MKKLIILGMMVVGMMSFGMEREESDRHNRYNKFENLKVTEGVSSSVVYDNDFFMELDSNRRHDKNN